MSAATDALAAAAVALAEALRAAATDPEDAVRLLIGLAGYQPAAADTASAAVGAVCRRAALSSLALACAASAPATYQDAIALRSAAAAAFDAEIIAAADAFDDATWSALRALRSAVMLDLATRAQNLPTLVTITQSAPLPALTLAYQLYQDATQADALIVSADPWSPLFMPLSFQAASP